MNMQILLYFQTEITLYTFGLEMQNKQINTLYSF